MGGFGGEFWRFFGFAKLLAQADYYFQIKSLCMFQLLVFPYVALITEHCHVNLQYSILSLESVCMPNHSLFPFDLPSKINVRPMLCI